MRLTLFAVIISLNVFTLGARAQTLEEINLQIKEAKESGDSLELTRGLYSLGRYYDQNNEINKSNSTLNEAVKLAESIKNNAALKSIANYLAVNYSYMGLSDSAIFYYNKSIDACIALNDSLTLPKILINLGDEYTTNSDYLNAINYSLEAVKIKESLNDYSNIVYYYQKLGEIYKSSGEKAKWEEYVLKGYELIRNEEYSSVSSVAAIYNDLGGIAEIKENYEEALMYYDTLISYCRENEYQNGIGVALRNSATIYKVLGNNEKALELALESNEYNSHSNYSLICNNNLLSELYSAQNDLSQAAKYAHETLSNKNIDNYPEERLRALNVLYETNKEQQNFEGALFWNEQINALSDSIRDSEVRTAIMDIEIAYQTERKEQQIELLTTENKLKNQRIRAGIFLLAGLLVTILLILYVLRIRKKQAQLIQNDLQQQVLRSQMNPHFIFNVLGSIQNFLLSNNTTKASNYLTQFASFTRSTLEFSSEESISLSRELEMLRNYIELEQMRMPDKFNFTIEKEDDLEDDFIFIPPMLIQPFIENAIKHGFKMMKKPGELKISVSDKQDWVEFIIEDNGEGFQKNAPKTSNHRSMAMEIFNKRRKLIQQKHKKEFKFESFNLSDINPDQSGVRIIINVPILDYD